MPDVLLFPDMVASLAGDPNVDREAKLHLVATWLALEEDGPTADELSSMPNSAWQRRRAFLRSTPAWSSAERMLAGY
jgi:hypothetical protein